MIHFGDPEREKLWGEEEEEELRVSMVAFGDL